VEFLWEKVTGQQLLMLINSPKKVLSEKEFFCELAS